MNIDHLVILLLLVIPSVIAAFSSVKNGRALKNGVNLRMKSPSSVLCPKCYHVFKLEK